MLVNKQYCQDCSINVKRGSVVLIEGWSGVG